MRMLTDPHDVVLDPFAGSCVTGEVAERLHRSWIGIELIVEYFEGARFRFNDESAAVKPRPDPYKIYHPAVGWNGHEDAELAKDGGRRRPTARSVATS